MNASDLYLACGCVRGEPGAVAAFATECFPVIEAAVRALEAPALVEDVRQTIFQKLFVGDAERPPRIRHYHGEGDLGTWVRVAATRQAIDILRREGRERPADQLPELAASDDDPELRFLKERYRAEFKQVFQAALAGLSSQQRNLLRYQLIGRLTMEQLAAFYRVNRATVVRWLHKVRERLLADTRRELTRRLRLDRSEFESVMRLIHSQLEVSMRRILEEEEG
jgi:RNA polymerase sigma-70 factor, ECF subfamily